MKKVLVFGINGFVGKEFAKEMFQNGYQIFGAGRSVEQNRDYEFFQCDIRNADRVEHLVAELAPDYIINLAAISGIGQSWEKPEETIQTNTIGALNILEAVRKTHCLAKVLLIGSSEEYAETERCMTEEHTLSPRNIYGFSKLWQEQIAQLYHQQYGISIICARTFNHTGRGQSVRCVIPSFCQQVAEIQKSGKDGVIYVGNIDIYRDISDVRDVVKAYRLLLESDKKFGIYNVCSGQAHTLREILDKICSCCEYQIQIVQDPERVRAVDASKICGDNSKLMSDTRWRPQYSMEDMVKDIYQCYMEE